MFQDCLVLFITFFKIGLFTIGGGYAMIPLIQTEVTETHKWCSVSDIIDYIAVSESTPGPFSINLSTFVGMRVAGTAGVLSAVTGLILPSFIIILIIAKFLRHFIEYRGVQTALYSLKPAVIGLMSAAVLSIALTTFNIDISNFQFSGLNFIEITILAIMLVMKKFLKMNVYTIIIISGLLGIIFYSVKELL